MRTCADPWLRAGETPMRLFAATMPPKAVAPAMKERLLVENRCMSNSPIVGAGFPAFPIRREE
jgi:hypothetical protein